MAFYDIDWLGEQDKHHGPTARAAVGILLQNRGWDWYYLTSRTELENALTMSIPTHETATWGGDEAILSISEWLDASRAVMLGTAFQRISNIRRGFRLRISKDVWNWSTEDAPQTARADLSQAVSDAAIFYEWPKDRRPRRTTLERSDGKVLVTSPAADGSGGPGSVLAEAIGGARFEPRSQKAHIVVARSIFELSSSNVVGDVVIVVNDDDRAVVARLDRIRVDNAARCIVRVSQKKADDWLRTFGSYWSGNAASIDDAVRFANATENTRGEVVAANQTFLQQSPRFLDWASQETMLRSFRSPPPSSEFDELTVRRSSKASDEPVGFLSPAPPPSKRVLDARIYYGKRRVHVLPLAGQLRIEVGIELKSPSKSGHPDFPDDLIDWKSDTRKLDVHMIELGSDPITRKLLLPRRGRSEVVDFDYTVIPGSDVDLRFMVCDGIQILQTARLKAKVGGRLRLSFEADFTSLELERSSFDLALMVNDSLGGRPSATILSPEGVQIDAFDTGEIGALRDKAREILETVVTNPATPLRSSLMQLANIGSELLEVLSDKVEVWPKDIDRIQLTTKDNAFFPLEFLFDGVVPMDPRAPLCSNYKACLRDPDRTSRCATRKDSKIEVLCPMGFLGVRTIIERHVWNDEPQAAIWLKESIELSHRQRLTQVAKVAFAASDAADEFDAKTQPNGPVLAKIQSIVDEFGARLETWKDWTGAVTSSEISMAVLIAHIEDTTIYIGANEPLNRARLEFGTVPIAILLGCRSAIATVASMSIPARIMRRGHTRVVVSTLTDILGRHANTAALHLAKRIRDASNSQTPVSLGEFIVEIRRELLAEDIAAGLILVALGDADIALGQ